MTQMRPRWIGIAVGVVIGVLVALLPFGKGWEIHSFTIIPGGFAAAFGATVAGYFVGPLVASRPNALGAVAVRFAVVMYLAAIPLVALDAALLGSRPLDEPWPVTFGPVVWIVAGTILQTPQLVVVCALAALSWTALVRRVQVHRSRSSDHVTLRDAD
jgi:hypothetical protein